MWKSTSITAKILFSVGIVLLVMVVPSAISLISQSKMIAGFGRLSDDNHLEQLLLEREIDHLKWVQSLSTFLINNKETELKLQADPTKCAFGKWYYGKERSDTEATFPRSTSLLKDIEEPHKQLHASAVKIQELRKAGEQDKLVKVFHSESVASLGRIQAILKEIREIVGSSVVSEGKEIEQTNVSSKRNSLIVIVLAVLIAVASGIATALSITRPLKKSVSFAVNIASGNLSEHLNVEQKDEVGVLAESLRKMVDNLKAKISEAESKAILVEEEMNKAQVATKEAEEARRQADRAKREGMLDAANKIEAVVESITSAFDQLNAQSIELSKNSDSQARRVTEVATAMEEMNSTIIEVAKNASQATMTSENV